MRAALLWLRYLQTNITAIATITTITVTVTINFTITITPKLIPLLSLVGYPSQALLNSILRSVPFERLKKIDGIGNLVNG